MDGDGTYLAHYGRKGMKWYQHVYATAQKGYKRYKAYKTKGMNKFNMRKKPKIIAKNNLRKAYRKRRYFTNDELQRMVARSKEEEKIKSQIGTRGLKVQKRKADIINKVDLKAAYKNRQYFTTSELQDLAKRSASIATIRKSLEVQSVPAKVKRTGDYLSDYAKIADNLYKTYNSDMGKAARAYLKKKRQS